MNTKTLGEQRLGVDFTPGTPGNEYAIKQKTAELINILEAFRTDERYQHSPETQRLIDEAQKGYEQAAMWAVKAVTGE
ncbi:hypothetical protein ACFS6H_20010 [Terrimonas rubra]|uniref:Acb2/Tad1 hairpin domain-containing protein n=1 Tax=Terrimonas rubra TaxID=1035890 RepID=A0ABW6ABC5_9BACT